MNKSFVYLILLIGNVFFFSSLLGGFRLEALFLSNFFFTTGMTYLLWGLFLTVLNLGLFRAASFGFRKLNRLMFRGRRVCGHSGFGAGRDEYYNYMSSRKKKKALPFVLTGGGFCLISAFLAFLPKT